MKLIKRKVLQQCFDRTTERGRRAANKPAWEDLQEETCVLRFRALKVRYGHAPIACPPGHSAQPGPLDDLGATTTLTQIDTALLDVNVKVTIQVSPAAHWTLACLLV